jgi:2-oxoglutarate ferredoxin oxidoreductase subunit beta
MSMTCGFDLDWSTFGVSGECGLVKIAVGLDVAKTTNVSAEAIVVHDAQVDNSTYAVALARRSEQNLEYTDRGVDSPW